MNIINGSFSVYLGNGDGSYQGSKVTDGIPAEVFTRHAARYLGIKIADSPTEMIPRQSLASVPYAYVADLAREAENLMGQVTVDASSGNVGIGKLSPSEKLEVNGSIKAAGTVKATSLEGNGSKITGIRQHSLDAADGSHQDALYVDSNGNVGIGTKSPVAALDLGEGSIKLGYRRVVQNCSGDRSCIATCPPGGKF